MIDEQHPDRVIAMPNELIGDMKEWLELKQLKTAHHQEFIYSYYWLMAYLWRYTVYTEQPVTQSAIKESLGYSPSTKQIDYIIKKSGILDVQEYTKAVTDYPVSWKMRDGKELSFSMLSEFDADYQKQMSKFNSTRFIVKAPMKSIGTESEDGIFWNSSNTHFIDAGVFIICMRTDELKSAGFYMYGILKYISDKSKHFNGAGSFPCSNKTLCDITGWNIKKVMSVTNDLVTSKLIKKEQQKKTKGSVNYFSVL